MLQTSVLRLSVSSSAADCAIAGRTPGTPENGAAGSAEQPHNTEVYDLQISVGADAKAWNGLLRACSGGVADVAGLEAVALTAAALSLQHAWRQHSVFFIEVRSLLGIPLASVAADVSDVMRSPL